MVMKYVLTEIDDRIRVTISMDDKEIGLLYFEKAKLSFTNKPLSMGSWACVDAKIEGLYEAGLEITPTEVMVQCQQEIRMAGY